MDFASQIMSKYSREEAYCRVFQLAGFFADSHTYQYLRSSLLFAQ
jgi:hypothetical protein